MEYTTDMSNLESERLVRLSAKLAVNPITRHGIEILRNSVHGGTENAMAFVAEMYAEMLKLHNMKTTWPEPPGTTTSTGAADEEPPF